MSAAAFPATDDIVAFRDHMFKFNMLTRILSGHAFKVINEGLFAVRDRRIVLRVRVAGESSNRLRRVALIEHQIVKGDRVSFVSFELSQMPPVLRSRALFVALV